MIQCDIQFGHAGAFASSLCETAESKNQALKRAGAFVPDSFELLPSLLNKCFNYLVHTEVIKKPIDKEVPSIPMDYHTAVEKGLVRKAPQVFSSISDDRGEEPKYCGVPVSSLVNLTDDCFGSLGETIGLLWFKKRLPSSITKLIEMILVLVADHGPAVSGAHNTIVASRAGKDLVSSLCSGLLTIGDRFGGALNECAIQFSTAMDSSLTPMQFVVQMKNKQTHIQGIGHRIKSLHNPDKRVTILKEYSLVHFPNHPTLDFALEVERITTHKKDNLILNVDGVIAVIFVDIFRNSGFFTKQEADDLIQCGVLNGLFVLGRSIGLVGHYIDQKRLTQPLFRQSYDDICYLKDENEN